MHVFLHGLVQTILKHYFTGIIRFPPRVFLYDFQEILLALLQEILQECFQKCLRKMQYKDFFSRFFQKGIIIGFSLRNSDFCFHQPFANNCQNFSRGRFLHFLLHIYRDALRYLFSNSFKKFSIDYLGSFSRNYLEYIQAFLQGFFHISFQEFRQRLTRLFCRNYSRIYSLEYYKDFFKNY